MRPTPSPTSPNRSASRSRCDATCSPPDSRPSLFGKCSSRPVSPSRIRSPSPMKPLRSIFSTDDESPVSASASFVAFIHWSNVTTAMFSPIVETLFARYTSSSISRDDSPVFRSPAFQFAIHAVPGLTTKISDFGSSSPRAWIETSAGLAARISESSVSICCAVASCTQGVEERPAARISASCEIPGSVSRVTLPVRRGRPAAATAAKNGKRYPTKQRDPKILHGFCLSEDSTFPTGPGFTSFLATRTARRECPRRSSSSRSGSWPIRTVPPPVGP